MSSDQYKNFLQCNIKFPLLLTLELEPYTAFNFPTAKLNFAKASVVPIHRDPPFCFLRIWPGIFQRKDDPTRSVLPLLTFVGVGSERGDGNIGSSISQKNDAYGVTFSSLLSPKSKMPSP